MGHVWGMGAKDRFTPQVLQIIGQLLLVSFFFLYLKSKNLSNIDFPSSGIEGGVLALSLARFPSRFPSIGRK
jgi:hypothetical protein